MSGRGTRMSPVDMTGIQGYADMAISKLAAVWKYCKDGKLTEEGLCKAMGVVTACLGEMEKIMEGK